MRALLLVITVLFTGLGFYYAVLLICAFFMVPYKAHIVAVIVGPALTMMHGHTILPYFQRRSA